MLASQAGPSSKTASESKPPSVAEEETLPEELEALSADFGSLRIDHSGQGRTLWVRPTLWPYKGIIPYFNFA